MMRTALVETAAKVNLRHTRLLPVTLPPGTAAQADPFQYCSSKSVMPYWVKVSVSVGSCGLA